jgi:hypothetical protein
MQSIHHQLRLQYVGLHRALTPFARVAPTATRAKLPPLYADTGGNMSRRTISRKLRLVPFLSLALGAPQALAANYGAIAFSTDTGGVGYSYDYSTQAEAENRALYECGPDCMVVLWFRNACGALAIGDGNGWGTGWAGSRAAAERSALSTCGKYTGGCFVKQWACTTR